MFIPLYPRFTPSSHALPRFPALPQFIHDFAVCPCLPWLYAHFTPFANVLHQFIHFYLVHACFTPFIPMFSLVYTHVFPQLSTFLPVLCTSVFTFFKICLPSMLTPVYPRSYPFTNAYSFLSTFYPVYPCLTSLYTFNPVYPNLSTFHPTSSF